MSDEINKKYANYINAYYITVDAVEIISKETNKAYAIDVLLKKLKINKDFVYTIGDGYSDIEMIRNYNGYCMKESVEKLKSITIKEYESVSLFVMDLMDDSK